MVFSAIDIGSNAVRLHFSNVYDEGNRTIFKKGSIVRVPIRLGDDAFMTGRISEEKSRQLVHTMIALKHLIEVHKPIDYLACATSAMRNAANADAIVNEIEKQSGISVNIIDGQREAELVYSNHVAEELVNEKSYLYIEVGGGSTELSLFSRNERIFSRSFPLGTVRLLHKLIDKAAWTQLKEWIVQETTGYEPLSAIGTGGNINTAFKLMRKKEGKPLTRKDLKKFADYIGSYSYDNRIKELGLRPDRADVILPAMEIFNMVMKSAGINEIFVPQKGLADGIIHLLYEKHRYRQVMDMFDRS